MDKKAQGLPITTIILAILGIVVLVILFAILTGRMAIFAGAANECPGVCLAHPTDVQKVEASPAAGVLETDRADCNPVTEKQLYGSFIASGIRGKDNKPVVCDTCCQRLA